MSIRKIVGVLLVLVVLSGCTALQQTDSSTDNLNNNQIDASTQQRGGDVLDLSNTGLQQVSQDVFTKTNLEELDVSNNQLTGALPAEIRHLQNLKVLRASNNQMTGVPAEVGQLHKLEILDLSNNMLTGLPYELGNLQNLKELNISGNNYSEHDLDIIVQNLPDSVTVIK